MLDLVRNQLKPIIDLTVLCRRPSAGSERAEAACVGGATKEDERHFWKRGMLELGARIRGHRLVTIDIRAFDTFLSSMKHLQVLCLVCMLSISCLHVV